jgi:hypothetical protein
MGPLMGPLTEKCVKNHAVYLILLGIILNIQMNVGHLFDGSLGQEGLHLLVDLMIVLSLGGGLKSEPRQGKG